MNRRAIVLAAAAAVAVVIGGASLWLLAPRSPDPAAPPDAAAPPSGSAASVAVAASASPPYYQCPNTAMYPIFSASIPGDASPKITNQDVADCYAWWEFITLNWPTASGAGFGDPGDLAPVQWQTWMEDNQLFPPGGTAPDAGALSGASAECAAQAGVDAVRARRLPILRGTSKFQTGSAEVFGPGQFDEAAPSNAPNWLASQNGHNVWYEVHVSPDEATFVVQNQFYNANAQWSWVTGDGGVTLSDAGTVVGDGGHAFNLPEGQWKGAVGAMETKASWMEVDDPSNAKWQTYKLTSAIVIDPSTNKCRTTTLALVGLHILHKTASQQSWVWATFEHVMNVPGSTLPDGGTAPDGGFNFYNPACTPQTVSVLPSCIPDGGTGSTPVPVQVGCTPNVSPPYYLQPGCAPAPIQVTRTNPIDRTASTQTLAAWGAIQKNYPKSVWMNYQLINVIWSSSSGEASGPVPVPLALNAMQPTTTVVANTTLETYAQSTTCTNCHVYATIARSAADCDPPWNSDISFLMSEASMPDGGSSCDAARASVRSRVKKRR
jgi:hypothetical protein